jgi:hypothetical protein
MSDTKSKKDKIILVSQAFTPIPLPSLPEPTSQFSSEGFIPSKERK